MIQTVKNWYHLVRSFSAAVYYGFPAKKLKIIGVTGTDGKTTTASLIYHILKSNGKKVSLISTVYAKIAAEEFHTGLHTTTPDSGVVQRLLSKSVANGDEYFILETTSHALDQNRNFGITYKIGVLTNITHEHLDYHKTIDRYTLAKAKLFRKSELSLLNRDDESYETMKKLLRSSQVLIETYGIQNKADFGPEIARKINIPLSDYNRHNFLAAYAVCSKLGLSQESILTAMKSFVFPKGRMETVYENDFKVIVDFAHTPNAIDQALAAVKKMITQKGRLIHVFGSAGLRDASKRPFMGESSARWTDLAIITEEDYRTEDPNNIAQAIAIGFEKNGFQKVSEQDLGKKRSKLYTIIIDRRLAIKKSVEVARKYDIIIITGKGHEESLCRGTIEYPWDDTKVVRECIKNRNQK